MTQVKRAIPFVLVVIAAWVGQYIYGNQAYSKVADLQSALTEACQTSPTIQVLVDKTKDDIRQTKSTPAKFFPDIPPAQFHALIADSVDRQQGYLHKLNSINCAQRYR